MKEKTIVRDQSTGRLFSLDFFRGFTMLLLVVEFTGLFSLLTATELENTWIYDIGKQFHHADWNGLRFWDLIQPYFMFIVGVAIPFSVKNRINRGQSTKQIRIHAIQRSLLLLFIGWALYYNGPGPGAFRFQNVLAQLSVTYLIAFLLMNKSFKFQVLVSLFLLLITEILYRSFSVEGFDQSFEPGKNFGTWFDLLYGGADLNGHWVSFNAIPTTAHSIWGVLTGQLLLSKIEPREKFKYLMIAGVVLIISGYALSYYTPIIKRISTSSFVLVSGGWTLLTMAFSYWLIDIKGFKKWTLMFAMVGMNPLFIYLFAHVGGARFVQSVIRPFTDTLFGWTGSVFAPILTSLVVSFLLWLLCYWLYKKKIFIRI